MTVIKHKVVRVGDRQTVTVTVDGEMHGPVDDTHPKYAEIVAAAKAKDPKVVDLMSPIKKVALGFHELSDRLVVRDRNVFWDGDVVNNSLTEQIIRFIEEGLDFQPLVFFYDKISQNPSKHSQEQLFNWLKSHKFTITAEGDILGYKGYRSLAQPKDGKKYQSTASGTASVNGKEYQNQYIPCDIGDTVTMPRSKVVDNPNADCSVGLHIGSPDYAKGYGDTRMAVLINPRDVVSVPDHANYQKMRVCRYYVMELADKQTIEALRKDAPKWEPSKPAPPVEEKTAETKPKTKSGPKDPTPVQPKSSILEDEKEEKVASKPAAKRASRAAPKAAAPKVRGTKATASTRPKAAKTAANKAPAKAAPKTATTKAAPKTAAQKGKATPTSTKGTAIDWTQKNLDRLLKCKDDAAMLRAFPGANLTTLKRRAATEKKKRAAELPPPTV